MQNIIDEASRHGYPGQGCFQRRGRFIHL